MKLKSQWAGLLILICVALAAFALDQWGRDRQPEHYTIHFRTGTEIEPAENALIEKIARQMVAQETREAIIAGHTGPRGDSTANQALSKERAVHIKTLLVEKGVSPARIKTFGLGAASPLEINPDEGQRSYYQRLKRVEVTLKHI